jgi:hypothetical protein
MKDFKTLGFIPYTKEELLKKIDSISISRVGNQIITKYFDRVINTTLVSDRYEVFDIGSYMKSKIDQITNNFNISYYKLRVRKGIQELTLISEGVDINNTIYYKTFFILNSSDRSRKLNINLGLYRADNNSYFISKVKNLSVCKRHTSGVTQVAEDVSHSIDSETFDEQIEGIKSLIGERVMLSEIKKIIIDEDLDINYKKYNLFKKSLLYSLTDRLSGLTTNQKIFLSTPSIKEVPDSEDFNIDAYTAFNCYIQIFSNSDSYIVKKETEKILKITMCFLRNAKLDLLLN